jgi:hypothetical protein
MSDLSIQDDSHVQTIACPEEIKRFNWGALLLSWVWGIRYGVWSAFLVFIPFVGWIVPLILGFKGNEWAYKKNPGFGVDKFLSSQRKWTIAGLFFWWFILALVGISISWFSSLKNNHYIGEQIKGGFTYISDIVIKELEKDPDVMKKFGTELEPVFKNHDGARIKSKTNEGTYSFVTFHVKGSKDEGLVVAKLNRLDGEWVVEKYNF